MLLQESIGRLQQENMLEDKTVASKSPSLLSPWVMKILLEALTETLFSNKNSELSPQREVSAAGFKYLPPGLAD